MDTEQIIIPGVCMKKIIPESEIENGKQCLFCSKRMPCFLFCFDLGQLQSSMMQEVWAK